MKLAEIAARLGCELRGDGTVEIHGLAPIEEATPGTLTFVANPRYRDAPQDDARRGGHRRDHRSGRPPALACARRTRTWRSRRRSSCSTCRHRSRRASIPARSSPPSAPLGRDACVGAFCVIGEDVVIGDGARLDPHVVIYPQVRIGDGFRAYAARDRP